MRPLLILTWLACSIALTADEHDLDLRLKMTADEYGYKTANLYELNRILPEFETKLAPMGIQVRIPPFYPLSSEQIVCFLRENGLDIKQTWDELVISLTFDEKMKMALQKQIPETLSRRLEEIRKNIETIFDHPQFSTIVTSDFLEFIPTSSSWIVRSSGMEDRIGLTNAGGNESIKHVAPHLQELFSAMGKVVSSYFSEKSIRQRLLADDPSILFLPITPVLIQEMVKSAKRPLEAVVHTTEQLGPTPNLVSINCGYDVVDSKGRADLYYYYPSGVGHAVLAKDIDHLEENCRIAIAAIAEAIESHFQRATDIELLVTTSEDGACTIHLVQARPLNRPQLCASPSYLSNLSLVPQEQIGHVDTIVAAGSYVRTITNRMELIVAKTLKEAEEQFLYQTPNMQAVQAIIIQSEAEPNSHEATTFACSGKLVMRMEELEKLNSFIEGGPFYLDPQQGLIVKKRGVVFESLGFITHPMQERVSIEPSRDVFSPTFDISENHPQEDIPSLFTRLKQAGEIESVSTLSSLLFRLKKEVAFLQSVKRTPASMDALQKMESLYRFAREKAAGCIPVLANPPYDLNRLAAIKPIEALFVQNEDPHLENCYSWMSILQKYQIRSAFLNDLSLPDVEEIGSNLYLLDALCEGSEAAMTVDLKRKWQEFVSARRSNERNLLSEMIHNLVELDALSPWMHTVFAASNSFEELYTEYLQALPFLKKLKEQKNRLSLIPVSDWGKPNQFENLMNDLPLEMLLSDEFMHVFGQPGKLKQILALSFMSHFIDVFDDQFIKTLLRSPEYSSSEQKVCNFKKVVERYFSILKTWEPLSTLTQDARSWAFADFLDDIKTDVPNLSGHFDFQNFDLPDLLELAGGLPEELFDELPDTTKDLIHKKFPSASFKEGSLLLVQERFEKLESFHSYIAKMQKGIESVKGDSSHELFPPESFNVASEIFVNVAKRQKEVNFDGYPLAAFFTLVHQNINSILTNIAIQIGLDQLQRPPLLQEVETKVKNLGFLIDESGQIKSPSLIGTKFAKNSIHLIYNLPLKLHGITYEMKYHHSLQEVEFTMNLVSIDNNLSTLGKLFEIGAQYLDAKNISSIPFDQDMRVSCTFHSASQIEKLDLFLQCIQELTSSKFKEQNQNKAAKNTERFASLINHDEFKKLLGDL